MIRFKGLGFGGFVVYQVLEFRVSGLGLRLKI